MTTKRLTPTFLDISVSDLVYRQIYPCLSTPTLHLFPTNVRLACLLRRYHFQPASERAREQSQFSDPLSLFVSSSSPLPYLTLIGTNERFLVRFHVSTTRQPLPSASVDGSGRGLLDRLEFRSGMVR